MRVILSQPATWHQDGDRNLDAAARALERCGVAFDAGTIVVLPELIGGTLADGAYEKRIAGLAAGLGSWVVGGSHHREGRVHTVNAGVVAGPAGDVVARYEKANPYGVEVTASVVAGRHGCSFSVDDRAAAVLLCADLWHAAALPAHGVDVLLVPAFSLTQRAAPHHARSLWRHMAVTRAYELAAFVAISDWKPSASYGDLHASGSAGLADPNPVTHAGYFRALGRRSTAVFELDAPLDALRRNRAVRSFSLRTHAPGAPS